MKAAILHGREEMRVEEIPTPVPGPGEVRIEIHAALTCGTDLKVFRRGYHAKMIRPPSVFGHELAGVISAVGSGVTDWVPGDRVVVANSAPCGGCALCRVGQPSLCEDLLFLNGAYAESIVVPARIVEKNLLRLQPATSFADAALVEPLACVVLGIDDCAIPSGASVLVIGAGPIGLMFARLCAHRGCRVTVAGRGSGRLSAASSLGATTVVDIGDGNALVSRVEAAGAGPFDVVIEAVGKPEVWAASVDLVRKGGVVNFFGGCPAGTSVTLDTTRLHYSSITLKASFHHTPDTIRRALQWIEQGVIRAADFVDGETTLDGLPGLFQSMIRGNKAVKSLVRVRPGPNA